MSNTAAKRARALRPVVAVVSTAALLMGIFPTAFASSPLGTPINAAPADGTHLTNVSSVSLDWTGAADASSSPVTYQYEVSTSASTNTNGAFASTVGTGSTASTAVTFTPTATGLYWWHVRATDGLGNQGAWSNFTSFFVDSMGSGSTTGTTTGSGSGTTTPPAAPMPLTPTNGSSLPLSSLTSLSWSSVTATATPVTYSYEGSLSAATNSNGSFTTPIVSGSGLSGTSASIALAATTTGTFYWHVRATDANSLSGAWSTMFSVNITGSSTGTSTGTTTSSSLPWPGNIWPYNGVVITSSAFTHVEWTKVTSSVGNNPVTYNYEVSNSSATNADGSFVTPIYHQNGIASTTLSTVGTPEGTYYWHVQAVDSMGTKSGWSTFSKVTVNNSATGTFGLGLGSALVGTSTAIFPMNGATITQAQDTHVDWTVASGTQPLSYVYQYSWTSQTNANGDYTFPSFTSGTLSSPTIMIDPGAGNAPGVYYWHVRAIDPAGNVGNWSSTFVFTVTGSSTGTTTGSGTGTTTGTGTGSGSGTGTTTGSVLGNATSTSQLITITPNDLLATSSLAAAEASNQWFFYDDGTGVINNALGTFVTGPGTPPFGTGSVQIAASSTDRINLATYQFKNIKLSDIAGLSYWAFAHDQNFASTSSSTPFIGADPYLQFNVDLLGTGTTTFSGRLAYLPRLNGTVATDTWQHWDAINNGTANWLFTGTTWPGSSTLGTTPMTWNQILAAFPNATTLSGNSFLGIRVGEPYPSGFTANIDGFSLALNSATTTATTTGSGSNATTTMATTTATNTTTFNFDPASSSTATSSNNGSSGGGGSVTSTGGSGCIAGCGGSGGSSGGGGGGGSVLGASTGPSSGSSLVGMTVPGVGSTLATAPTGTFFPAGSVLGASTVGTPNTGAGGNAIINTLILVLAAVLIAGGITVLFTWRENYDV